MNAPAARYDRWKAPTGDGQVLLWPTAADLLQDARENHRKLTSANSILLQNVPLPLVRRQMRQSVGHDDLQLLIATGHQAELQHPGVWAKNALIAIAADKLAGRAVHFVVDTDEPKHLLLRWPGGSVPLTDDPSVSRAAWSSLVAPPTRRHLSYIEEVFTAAAAHWRFRPLAPEVLAGMRLAGPESSNLPDILTRALHRVDLSLGLRYEPLSVSTCCDGEPYLLFVYHVLARADHFGADYNCALQQFRQQSKIKDPGRPMPDLKLSGDSCEAPFWLDSLSSGRRSRASVVRSNGEWALSAEGEQFRFNPGEEGWSAADRLKAWLDERSLRLSPRALTLTAVLRLLLADQFVHGIGGGRYDQVLDALIARHFDFEPPRFAVTTATLYFPDAIGQPRVCLPCLVREGHRLKHGVLGREKIRLVEQIAALPRGSLQRSELFAQMHDKLTAAWRDPPVRAWEHRFREAEARAQEERVLFDRELFYAIQSRQRLTGLIGRYRQRLSA